MARDATSLPSWLTGQPRPFPDANLLLVRGRQPALVDTGFVGHAEGTAAWARAQASDVALVVNTHWRSDHVGSNALLQAAGAGIAASAPDADAVARRSPGCCLAEYLDQPVAAYTVDEPLHDNQVVRLGDADWHVVRTPGHTPGHLSLWEPQERVLVVGDALRDDAFVAVIAPGPPCVGDNECSSQSAPAVGRVELTRPDGTVESGTDPERFVIAASDGLGG
jgi:glyoxylase-like metal-dependent hydrolase (beta-lactamase superfamily II)